MREYVMVVGSGMMGSGIGAMSALAGRKTILVDLDEERVKAGAKKAACISPQRRKWLKYKRRGRKGFNVKSKQVPIWLKRQSQRLW